MTILIQRCDECGAANYPARAVCRACLSAKLSDQDDSGKGYLLATSMVHRSLEPALSPHLPLRIAAVLLDSGPHVLSFVDENAAAGDRVRLSATRTAGDDPVWFAHTA